MAKINHNSFVDVINDIFTNAKREDVMHLVADDTALCGRQVEIGGKELLNFGTCGYMGLESHPNVIQTAQEYCARYGVQFSISRSYCSAQIHRDLEQRLSSIYGGLPVVTYSSTSAAHTSIIPTLVGLDDAVIVDQQAHMSVQTGIQLLHQKDVPVTMIRHSDMNMLEEEIKNLRDKHKKIWYMMDGVYSMYGDTAPINELIQLQKKYDSLNLYFDDAHGMSWCGKYGGGYVFREMPELSRTVLITTLAKGFGAIGGLAVFSDDESYKKVSTFGGPLTYSHPLPPPMVGAAIASADIHLSPELGEIQTALQERLRYLNNRLEQTQIPVLSNPETPIYYLGAGKLGAGYRLFRELLRENIFVNIGLFPGVPMQCTGIRFTVTTHNELKDLDRLVDVAEEHYLPSIEAEGQTLDRVRKYFRLPALKKKTDENTISPAPVSEKADEGEVLHIQWFQSIADVDAEAWNQCFQDRGNYDVSGLSCLEKVFSNQERNEDNWSFHYCLIRDEKKNVVLATFFTVARYKEDFLAPSRVSQKIEEIRKADDPDYLTSVALSMGSMISEGEHLFLKHDHPQRMQAFQRLLAEVEALREQVSAETIVLRDFVQQGSSDGHFGEIEKLLAENSYVKMRMPANNIVDLTQWNTEEEFLANLKRVHRRSVKSDALKHVDRFRVEVKTELTEQECRDFYELFKNCEELNFAMNIYPYPRNILQFLSGAPNWEFLIIRGNDKENPEIDGHVLVCMWCYRAKEAYCGIVMGIDYDRSAGTKVYDQALYQVVKRAKDIGAKELRLGYSADRSKKKIGAKQFETFAFIQTQDNFKLEVIETM